MHRVSVDTNVFLRLFLKDDASQHKQVKKAIENADIVFIGNVVLAETIWALTRIYKWGKSDILRFVSTILDTEVFEFENREAVEMALFSLADGSAGFADYLILATSVTHGAIPLLTFDGKLAKNSKAMKVGAKV